MSAPGKGAGSACFGLSTHHGAGRLALDAGAPIIPTAMPSDALAELIDRRVWLAVQKEYGRLRAMPGLIAAALTALGVGGLVARRRRATAAPPRLLGFVEPRKLRRRTARRSLLDRHEAGTGSAQCRALAGTRARCRVNHSAARRCTASSVPGSSNR